MKRWLLLIGLTLACGGTPPPAEQVRASRGQPMDFAFGTLDGGTVTGEGTRGRVTLLLFVTTFDLPSQAAAKRLAEFVRTYVPKVNAAAIVLEAAENAVLVDVFRKSLGLPFPVALADSVELRASDTFAEISGVPTLIVLDPQGRLVYRGVGLFTLQKLDAWVKEAQP